MTYDELRAALASAAGKATETRDAVRACIRSLRDGTADDVLGMAAALAELVRHPDARVRLDVASGCDLFPDPFFDRAYSVLTEDVDHYVVRNAKLASDRRVARRRERVHHDEQHREIERLLEEMERKHGKAAGRLAQRILARGPEYFVKRLDHQMNKVEDTIQRALATLNAQLMQKTLSRADLMAQRDIVRSRFAYTMSIRRRALQFWKPFHPAFASEVLREVVQAACDHLVHRLGERAAQLDLTVDVDPALRLDLDRHALLEALDNVLQNAVEAYPEGERVRVGVRARTLWKGSQVEVAVEDWGVGMTEEQRARMFVPFESEKPGGTGLGMLMVRKMVEDAHGGEVGVESVPRQGTTVTLRVPARQAAR